MALFKQTGEENGVESGKMLESRLHFHSSLGRDVRSLPMLTLGVWGSVGYFSRKAVETWHGIGPANSVANGI